MNAQAAAYQIDGRPASPEAFYAVACDPRRSVAVEACAGAGKTWMLVSRMLRALADGCAPQDILAITFTKKAAGEMRDRLSQVLRQWASMDEEALLQELRLRGVPPEQARAQAPELRGLHARVLATGRSVQVRTFHSWFAAILRNAPLSVLQDLGLPPSYELLEDDSQAVERVWPRFYAALAANAEDQADFFDAVREFGRSQTLKALTNALAKRVEFVLADEVGVVDASVEPFAQVVPALAAFADPVHALGVPGARARWHARAQALGQEANKTPRDAAARVIDAFELPDGPDSAAQRLAILRKAFFVADEDRLTKNLTKFAAAQEAEAELAEVCLAVRQHKAWAHHQRLARLTRVLLRCYADLKRERGWVDMNDVEGAARHLLGNAELSGWMQQRLDARIRQLLIDEFQDTNPLQWQALYGWLSAYAGAGSADAPVVFLVGDPKQSIYRFRRAEPQVFKAAQAFVVQGLGGALLSCDHTRRCAPAVVSAFNAAMLEAVQAGEYGTPEGSAYRAHTTASQAEGAVLALPPVPRPEKAAQAQDEWRDSLTTPRHTPEDTMSAREARQAADWLCAEIAAGRLAPGEVMVLARKRERLAWMHEALRERGIASEQPEKLDLGDHPAVQDIVALVDALVSPHHDLSLARALRSPVFGWGDAQLAELAKQSKASGQAHWWDVLQAAANESIAPPEWVACAERLRTWQKAFLSVPPHDALAQVYREADVLARYAQAVPSRMRASTLSALRDLLAQSLAQDGGRFLTAYRWVRALKAGGIAATPCMADDAVRLLTIHGAKGLEAHTVLLLDTDSAAARADTMGVLVDWPGEMPHPRRFVFLASEKQPPACARDALALEQQARALEELNALYVALTRAEHQVVVSSFDPYSRGQARSWAQRLRPLAEPLAAPEAVEAASQQEQAIVLPELPAWRPPAPTQVAPAVAEDDATRIGKAMHRLLQWLPTPLRDFRWADVHAQAVAKEFSLDREQVNQALLAARSVLDGEAAWAWDSQHLDHWGNEVELWHQGERLRLDRLVRERATGCWWVLDFKSTDTPQHKPELLAQLRRYREALQAAHPGQPLRLAFINAKGRLIEPALDSLDVR